jgi:hypothetical protein
VCLNPIENEYKTELRCNHKFHPNCIIRILRIEGRCPICGDDGLERENQASQQPPELRIEDIFNPQTRVVRHPISFDFNTVSIFDRLPREDRQSWKQWFMRGINDVIYPIKFQFTASSIGHTISHTITLVSTLYIIKYAFTMVGIKFSLSFP